MNSSFAMEPFAQDNLLVTIALVLAALLALITIAAMVWGARLKRQRKEAEAEEQARIDDLRASGVTPTNVVSDSTGVVEPSPPPAPAPAPPPPPAAAAPPLAPALPPLDDAPAPGTPALADEPIAAAAPLDATPASVAADADAPQAAPADDAGSTPVTVLKGLGPRIAARLAELGITRVDQLAWLDDAEATALDAQLGNFQGRMERDRWREQARYLAQGDRAGFEAQFGKLG